MPQSWAQFREELLDEDDEAAEDDEPEAGKPKAGEPNAMDSRTARDDYHKRFPNAQRDVVYTPEISKPVHMTAAAARDYAKRFPDSSRLGKG